MAKVGGAFSRNFLPVVIDMYRKGVIRFVRLDAMVIDSIDVVDLLVDLLVHVPVETFDSIRSSFLCRIANDSRLVYMHG